MQSITKRCKFLAVAGLLSVVLSVSAFAQAATALTIILPGERPKDMDMVAAAIEKAVAKDVGAVKLNFEFYSFDDFNSKVALKVATKESMDLIFDPFWLNFYQLQAQGAFLPLNEIVKQLSFYGKAGNVPDAVWKAVSVEGKIYGLPAVENNFVKRADSMQVAVRADLYGKYAPKGGIKTGPDMLAFLKAVKKNEPQYLVLNLEPQDGIPFSPAALTGKPGVKAALWGPLDTDLGLYADALAKTDKKTPPKVFSAWFTKEFENDVAGAIEIQKSGLITTEQINDKRQSFIAGRLAAVGADRDDYSQIIYPAVKDSFGVKWIRPDLKPKGILERAAGNWFTISATSRNPLVAAKLVNWIMASRDNYELWAYGIKDTHFKINDKNAIEKIDPEKRNYEMLWWYVFNRNNLRVDMSGTPDAADYVKWCNVDANSYPNPLIGFPLNLEPIKAEIAQVKAVISEYQSLTLGYKPISELKTYRDKLNTAGLKKVLDEINRQVAAWWAANNK